jgi:hypothetical protein
LSGLVDHPDLSNPDSVVDADAIVTSWAAVESDMDLRAKTSGVTPEVYFSPAAGPRG